MGIWNMGVGASGGSSGGSGTPGRDGVSPIVELTRNDDSVTLKVTDAEGEKTAVIYDGKKGDPGDSGTSVVDYNAYGLPVLNLNGDVSTMTKDNAVDLTYVYGDRSGTASVKWQGSSSLSYPKKNYTIKFDNAFEAFDGWGEQKKYCLKANYIDHSHARNIVSAKLWGQIVKSRKFAEILLDIGKITGLLVAINGTNKNNKISISEDGVLTNNSSAYSDGYCVFDGVTFEPGDYVVSFEYYNPQTMETDPNACINICFYADGGTAASTRVRKTFDERQEWGSYSGTFTVTKSGAKLSVQHEGDATLRSNAGYQFRNIKVVRSNGASADLSVLAELPNGGAIDGFPCIIKLNGGFHGLYTFNIPKDGWMFGMGNGQKEAIVCADTHSNPTKFKELATMTTADFDLEYAPDKDNAEWVKTSLNTLISAVMNSDGTDLDTTVAQYLDWQSAIDYYILVVLIRGEDMTDKNYLLATYDGTKWFFSAYDMDSTYGLTWDGKKFSPATSGIVVSSYANSHRVMELIKNHKADALKARYDEIRKAIMSEDKVAVEFLNFVGAIPTPVFVEDVKRWPTIPSTAASTVNQILNWYRMRIAVIDKEIDSM